MFRRHEPEQARENVMILLLSSEPIVRSVMKEVLEHAGYVVIATGSFATAVERLRDCDLLITHPYVECIPGHEAAKYLRERNRLDDSSVPKRGGYIFAA